MLPRKCFENLGSVLAILVLFVQFVRKTLFKIFTSNFESFTKYDAMMRFVHTFRFMLVRRRDYFLRRGSKLWKICIQSYGKFVFIKDIVEKCLLGVCIPHMFPSLDQLLLISSLVVTTLCSSWSTFKWLFLKARKTGGMDDCIIINKLSSDYNLQL